VQDCGLLTMCDWLVAPLVRARYFERIDCRSSVGLVLESIKKGPDAFVCRPSLLSVYRDRFSSESWSKSKRVADVRSAHLTARFRFDLIFKSSGCSLLIILSPSKTSELSGLKMTLLRFSEIR
jgi:hypothetical protein